MLEKKLALARKGREEWLLLEKQHQISESKNTRVLLYPDKQTDWNGYSLKYMEQYIEEYHADRLVILSYDENILQNEIFEKFHVEVTFVEYSREQAEALMAYYQLLEFTKRLTIISLDEPEGRNGSSLIGVEGLTVEDVVRIGVMRIGASGFNFDIGQKWKQKARRCNG